MANLNQIKKIDHVTQLSEVPKEAVFYEMKDAKGIIKRIANMNNPLVRKTKGIVTIEAIRRGKHKQLNLVISTSYDKVNKVIYGIPSDVDANGNIIFKKFRIPEFKQYNLSNIEDSEEWAVVRRHACMEGNVSNGVKPIFRIYDEEKIAQEQINKLGLVAKASEIARNMKLKDWIPASRFFGKDPAGMSPLTLQAEIYRIAQEAPADLINYWEASNRKVIDLFSACEAVGLVSHDYTKGWLYKNALPMGPTRETAINFLAKDPVQFKSVEQEIKLLDDAEKVLLSDSNPDNEVESEEEQYELATLKFKAANLKIKGYETMEISKLKEKVEAKEKIALSEE